ncbi:twin-arginine translocation signal domain-containing protein [Alkalihalobacillus sp. LMS39]|uniref:Acg family FMN-binding oxidoreductase n=1 Tax=Alkalihalobacillus sp. LMS39 TaxID=2924032 RepID=UPI001FB23524|nr:twin-arginine translocation signal domain-containing protein [Alkalihalobacillus sp. LMS39]UOE95426.1 twin-arginine translocation signal domain-containing protein [Alkalihalobacillus sp. LMS39]
MEMTVMNKEDTISRRQFLKKAGSTVILLAVGGVLFRAYAQGVFHTGKGPAYELWKDENATGLTSIVHAAVLASNPHNSQPWFFHVSDTTIDLYADKSRHLGPIDPFYREMYIGLGCAIENMMLASKAYGYNPTLSYFPDPLNDTYVAKFSFTKQSSEVSPLYTAIRERHTNRGAYDATIEIPKEHQTAWQKELEDPITLSLFTSKKEKQFISQSITDATQAFISTKVLSQETNKWFRQSWDDLQSYRDGITLDAQGESFFIRFFGKILPPLDNESSDQFWLKATKNRHTDTAYGYGVLSVSTSNHLVENIQLGRVWQRIHLQATNQGIGMHPLNQLNEMADFETHSKSQPHFTSLLDQITIPKGQKAKFIFRYGYPSIEAKPSPRRSIESIIV